MRAYILTPHGEKQEASPSGDTFTLEELQNIVGGYIEVVRLTVDVVMVVDDEGKYKDKDYNEEATKLFHKCHPKTPDFIVGTVLVCDSKMIR